MTAYHGLTEEQIEEYRQDGLSNHQLAKQNEQAIHKLNAKLSALIPYTQGPRAVFRIKELRLALLGKTGSGKSSTGNLIIGRKVFEESHGSTSCTAKVQVGECEIDGVRVRVLDTPGLMDTQQNKECIIKEITKVMDVFHDGIHGFLFVYNLGNHRYTSEEKRAFHQISSGQFGPRFMDHCFIILTNGYLLSQPTLADFLESESDTELGHLLKITINRRVIAIENSEKTHYGRKEQRQQIIRLVASYVKGAYNYS